MTTPAELYRARLERQRFADLAVAYAAPTDTTALSVSVPANGAGWVVVPQHIRAHSQLIGCRSLSSLVLGPILDAAETRLLKIGRYAPDGTLLTSIDTPLVQYSDYDRLFDVDLEVDAVQGAPLLDGATLRVEFDGKDTTYERQHILINYKIVKAV